MRPKQEAENGLETAIRLEPNNPEYWYRFGHFQQFNLEQPDSSLAEFYFRRAIALNPLSADAWLDLGTSYELDGKIRAAREAFLQAKLSYPSSAEVSWRYGNFLLRAGDLPDRLRRTSTSGVTRPASCCDCFLALLSCGSRH